MVCSFFVITLTLPHPPPFPPPPLPTSPSSYIFNHVKLIVEYHQVVPEEEAYRVVGFLVEPISVKHKFSNGFDWDGKSADGLTKPLDSCSGLEMLNADDITDLQVIAEGEKIVFTYDVVWAESETRWASRWDIYLSMDGAVSSTIHWFSIVNSLLIILFLTTMIGMVLFKNLRRDINEYNRNLTDEEKAEEREDSGWKLVHADVFRPPTQHPMLFCVFVGAGTQFVMMTCVTMVFACLGFLSPARRGSMVMMLLVMYVIFGGERAKRASLDEMATDKLATSNTKLTHSIILTRRSHSRLHLLEALQELPREVLAEVHRSHGDSLPWHGLLPVPDVQLLPFRVPLHRSRSLLAAAVHHGAVVLRLHPPSLLRSLLRL